MRILHPVAEHAVLTIPVNRGPSERQVHLVERALQGKPIPEAEFDALPTNLQEVINVYQDADAPLAVLAQALTPGFLFDSFDAGNPHLHIDLGLFASTRLSDVYEDYNSTLDNEKYLQSTWVSGRGVEFLMLCHLYPNSDIGRLSEKDALSLFLKDRVTYGALQVSIPDPVMRYLLTDRSVPEQVWSTLNWSLLPPEVLTSALRGMTVRTLSQPDQHNTLDGVATLAYRTSEDKEVFTSTVKSMTTEPGVTVGELLEAI